MHLIKEWWFLIAFTIGIFGGLYKIKKYSNLITWGLAIFGSLLFWYLLLRIIF